MIIQGKKQDEYTVLLPHERQSRVNKIVANFCELGVDEKNDLVYSITPDGEYVISSISEFNTALNYNEN